MYARSIALLAALTLSSAVALRSQDVKPASNPNLPIAGGKFQPNDESLKQYQYPEWFRDAKFGIWAHWGPQAVPRQGDWYAKRMYDNGGGPGRGGGGKARGSREQVSPGAATGTLPGSATRTSFRFGRRRNGTRNGSWRSIRRRARNTS